MTIDDQALKQLPYELQAEISENQFHKQMTPSEFDEARRLIEPYLAAAAKARQRHEGRRNGGGKFSPATKGKTRDLVGRQLGISGRSLEKIRAVMDAARGDPGRFGDLVSEMDRSGNVDRAHRNMLARRDEGRVANLQPVAGKFPTLVVDPPWDYKQWRGGRAGPTYATMSHQELLTLPIPTWAASDCHLYVWTTNAFMPQAVELVAAWGFEHRTILTWVKPRFGFGKYFRNQTEQVLFAIKGELAVRCHDISTAIAAPQGSHSEKPERFYEIVRQASPPPYGEAFQRHARPDFVNLFDAPEAWDKSHQQ
jgi:N6-adenosine-specific RNA methylase IME4